MLIHIQTPGNATLLVQFFFLRTSALASDKLVRASFIAYGFKDRLEVWIELEISVIFWVYVQALKVISERDGC